MATRLALTLMLISAIAPRACSNTVRVTGPRGVRLYDTVELTAIHSGVDGNRFNIFPSVAFRRGGRTVVVDGFYDGDSTWRARFMPDQEGEWRYTWAFQGQSVEGSFLCAGPAEYGNHGHVKRDPKHPRYLMHDDGATHYWYGGKWIAANNYGPRSKGGEANPDRLSDAQLLDYLDECQARGHNGLLVKLGQFALQNNGAMWDLNWLRRAEWLVREMGKRGVYCQLSLFDTWSRDSTAWFEYTTDGRRHPFNAWAPGDEAKKERYIRTIVARFAGYHNVYWELGNEMEHHPNSGAAFAAEANEKYLPWIRKHDPYGLPIGVSEESIWRSTDVDIAFLHQTSRLPRVEDDRPTIMNELVFGWHGGELYKDETMRDGANRLGYRRTFWRVFTRGGSGCGQATWLDIATPLNDAALDVMDDQHRLREFIEALPVDIRGMGPDAEFVVASPGEPSTRSKLGKCYVTYFLLEPGESAPAGQVELNLPPGAYEASWHDPKTGAATDAQLVGDRIDHPAFSEDIVLRVVGR